MQNLGVGVRSVTNTLTDDGYFEIGFLIPGMPYENARQWLVDYYMSELFHEEWGYIQLELGSTATDYEPYSGQTIHVEWTDEAGTVHGGKLDVISGELSVDRATIDLASLTWKAYGTAGTNRRVGSNVLPNVLTPSANNVKGDFITEQYKTVVYAQLNYLNFSQIAMTPTGTLTLGFDDVNYPSGRICYKLAEPIVYHLTPHEVQTLLGQNNIWADCGDIESVEYSADTKLYIDNKITQLAAQIVS